MQNKNIFWHCINPAEVEGGGGGGLCPVLVQLKEYDLLGTTVYSSPSCQ